MKKIKLKTGDKTFWAYYFETNSKKEKPGIILLTEIWGVNKNILDIAKRLNKKGYNVLLPDLLIETGIPKNLTLKLFIDLRNPETRKKAEGEARKLFTPIRKKGFEKETIMKIKTCFEYLNRKGNVGKIGVMGFSFGGRYSYILASKEKNIEACVSFYGRSPEKIEEIKKIDCPVLVFHGAYDEPALKGFAEFVKRMKKLKKDFTYFVYPKTKHSFMNSYNEKVYNKKSSEDAWKKLLNFFKKNLS